MNLRRRPRKTIRITQAAKMLGCSSESIRTGAIGGFKIFRLKEARTSPLYCYEREVLEFIERRQEQDQGRSSQRV